MLFILLNQYLGELALALVDILLTGNLTIIELLALQRCYEYKK